MKILIATPAFGGIITTRYMECFLQTMGVVSTLGHQITVGLSDRDALISRARNHLATIAMENDFDKVLFIDADNVWKPEHVLTLLKSDKLIVGGTYPYKAFPIRPILNPLQEHYGIYNRENASMETYNNFVKEFADENGEAEVASLPGGFLMIDVKVFKELAKTRPKYKTWNGKEKDVSDFFPIGLRDIEGTDVKAYETEDWGFCSSAREAGFKIYLQTKCVIDHLGFHQFSASREIDIAR